MPMPSSRRETTHNINAGVITIEVKVDDCMMPSQWFQLMDAVRNRAEELGMGPQGSKSSFTPAAKAEYF
jgi:hypothetical protein